MTDRELDDVIRGTGRAFEAGLDEGRAGERALIARHLRARAGELRRGGESFTAAVLEAEARALDKQNYARATVARAERPTGRERREKS